MPNPRHRYDLGVFGRFEEVVRDGIFLNFRRRFDDWSDFKLTEIQEKIDELYQSIEKLSADELNELLFETKDETKKRLILTIYTYRLQQRQEEVINQKEFRI